MSRERDAAKAKIELEMTERAFDLLEKKMFDELMGTAAEHSEKRERLFFGMRALRMAQQMLVAAAAEADLVNYEQLLAEHGFTKP